MTLNIPSDLEHALLLRAQQRQVSLEDLVCEALTWYIHLAPATLDELAAWQEIRDEALELIEDPPA